MYMKLSVVIPTLGQHELAKLCITQAMVNRTRPDTDIYVLDNGSDLSLSGDLFNDIVVLDFQKNVGVYPAFPLGFSATDGDVVLFIHSDLIIDENGYDDRIMREFEKSDRLGLVGFVGSNEIDFHGGRGGGTTSNFQGKAHYGITVDGNLKEWKGSPARDHGIANAGFTNAAVVDGCAMAIRRSTWEKLPFREDFPPHHFYDRLISCQMQETGATVAVLGIACDHISGQTVSKEERYGDLASQWLEQQGLTGADNPDHVIYKEAEHMWLTEYRDIKHFIPRKV